ncbi:hypothetical protein AB0K00_36770 [Dactylosporangium sp. NPDC049525]|uniref:hypothetical protein n=1 Tax=Dactylosporangium sp. NPDC049525 TaxID=3154730 RepID=UPI00343CF46B
MNAHVWTAARNLATALRLGHRQSATGRTWFRAHRDCPSWCGLGHRCTARLGYPSGEHRSTPLNWTSPYGGLVATRIESANGVGHVELRLSVRLSPDEATAVRQAHLLAAGVDLTARAVLAEARRELSSGRVAA